MNNQQEYYSKIVKEARKLCEKDKLTFENAVEIIKIYEIRKIKEYM